MGTALKTRAIGPAMKGSSMIALGFRRRYPATSAAALLLVLTLTAIGCTPSDLPFLSLPSVAGHPLPSFAPVVQGVMPAVVNVSAVQRASKAADDEGEPGSRRGEERSALRGLPPSAFDEFLRRFFAEKDHKGMPVPSTAVGSGFIIDPSGYVVTDDHVVENAARVVITLQDGAQHSARIIGRDAMTDLALLKIDTERPLPYVKWGDSDAARVGDWVLAIGNPFGLDNTVSSGIISARGRDIHAGPYDDFLQIDAAINRGNSGGPTFDLNGDVIGINTAIYSPNGGSVGIGFAIPANLARPLVEQLKEHGKVPRGWLGVQIQPVTPAIAESFGLPEAQGALVAGVSAGSPAAGAGFAQGDIILAVDGHTIARMRDLPLVVAETAIGKTATVTVWRGNAEITLRPVIGEMPQDPEVAQMRQGEREGQRSEWASVVGLKLAPLTPQRRQRLGVPQNVNGVVVTAIDAGSPFADLDLLPGDVIEAIDKHAVSSSEDAIAKLREAAASGRKNVLMLINRQGTDHYLALSIDNNGQKPRSG
jgi:serine protease Do